MENNDPELWKLAQKRASFKHHLTVYIIMNIFFWLVWYFTNRKYYVGMRFPWQIWPMFGWGLGVFFHYMGSYVYPKNNSVEREYQKLKN
ncbi:MAG TPA: 2TM domain-containing protein [Chitinophagaceae bacterium]|nr:2TM domain-containing protein [Chitinophagaceae bacterium]